jgi:hypothetical protein
VGDDLAVDVRFPDPPRDQLRVLRAEVDDEDGVERLLRDGDDVGAVGVLGGLRPGNWELPS